MKRLKRRNVKFNMAGIVGNVLLAASLSVLPVYSQQIITDGNTATNLNVSGSTTTVTTTTTKGANAFNSFSKFNVDTGNKVELVVPDASDNLINLVHDEASVINGTLNSIKAGQVGGNIFLVNPHGITVGAQGVINVGSLTAITPTTDFMNTFFTALGDPVDTSVADLINGTAPINESATIDIQGKINAITDVKIDTGIFTHSGEIYTDANYGIDMGDIVNLNSLDYVAGNDYNNLTLDNGSITINAETSVTASNNMFAGDTVNVSCNGPVTMNMATIAGDTTINANGEASISGLFDGNATVNAKDIELTKNLYSEGGDISLISDNLDISNNNLDLNFIEIRADNISINALYRLCINGGDFIANNNLIINKISNENITSFVPNSVMATNIISDFFIINNDILEPRSNISITLGNLENFIINGSPINLKGIYVNSDNYFILNGNNTIDGDIIINSPIHAGLGRYQYGDTYFGDITANNIIINSPYIGIDPVNITANNISLNSTDQVRLHETTINASGKLTINNTRDFLPKAINVDELESNFMGQNEPFIINETNDVVIGFLDKIFVNNQPLNPTSISITTPKGLIICDENTTTGNINLTAKNIQIVDKYSLIDYSQPNSLLKGKNITFNVLNEGDAKVFGNILALEDFIIQGEAKRVSFNRGSVKAQNINISTVLDYPMYINGTLETTGSPTNLLINSDGNVDPSSTITPTIIGGQVILSNYNSFGGSININHAGEILGLGTLKAYGGGNIDIANNSSLNLCLENVTTKGPGQIIINGTRVTEDINNSIGVIDVMFDNPSSGLGDVTILNNSLSTTMLTGSLNASDLNINSQGRILLFNNTINSDVILNTSVLGADGPAEIMLGTFSNNLTINGNLSATATNGNIYYYGGSVGGNATVDAGKMVGFMNVNIGGDLDVDAQAFGFFGGSVGGDMNIDADQGILIGVGNLLTVNGNADLDSLYGPVAYYLGDVGGNLTIDAGGIVNVGNAILLTQHTIDYNGQTYDITDLPYPVPADNNNFTVGSNLTINTPADVEFEGQVSGLVNVAGDNITHIENGDVNIGTMNSTNGDIEIEANTGAVDINYISTTGDIDINARDGININTIDPANINLAVQREGGSVIINTAHASNSVNIKADNVQGVFQNLNNSKALEFNVVGNDGNLANNVNISAASNTGLVFNSLKSVNANLRNLTGNTNLEVNYAVVTNQMVIDSDFVNKKDLGSNGTPKTINISGFNTFRRHNIIAHKDDLNVNLPARTDVRDTITLDNDINQVNQTATEKLGEDLVYNVENTETPLSVNKASGSIVPDSAEFYLDENFENLTKELLDQANELYNQALENGESEEQAKEKAKQYLLDSKLSPEAAKKLLEKQGFNSNIKFRKVLKLISLNN